MMWAYSFVIPAEPTEPGAPPHTVSLNVTLTYPPSPENPYAP